jgi:hypothetical protein
MKRKIKAVFIHYEDDYIKAYKPAQARTVLLDNLDFIDKLAKTVNKDKDIAQRFSMWLDKTFKTLIYSIYLVCGFAILFIFCLFVVAIIKGVV